MSVAETVSVWQLSVYSSACCRHLAIRLGSCDWLANGMWLEEIEVICRLALKIILQHPDYFFSAVATLEASF